MKKQPVVLSLLLVAAAMALLIPSSWRAQTRPAKLDYPSIFNKRDVMIPMRDGVRLHTEIYVPKQVSKPLPFIFERTPYCLRDGANGFTPKLRIYDELIKDGYIFVFQDIRGRYGSDGHFVMFRDPCTTNDPKCIDEGTDTNDTVDWLLKSVPGNNGRVGILGISYGGWLTTMAILHPSPAIKAASEQASPADQFLGDDFHHNGAFRESYGFEYATEMETGKTNFLFKFSKFDTFDWYLSDLGALSNANRLFLHGSIPTWNDFVKHPNYDAFWQRQAFAPYLKDLTLKV
ncbi:MAG: CocE/NonD family hydrolase, partial [Candidatus Dormibacteraceae bacterium]